MNGCDNIPTKMYSVDETYDIIGHFGPGQLFYFCHLSLVHVLIGEHMLLNIYVGLEPSFTCLYNVGEEEIKLSNKCPDNEASKCKFQFYEEHKTIVSEWNLVCNEKYKVALVQSIWMSGVMVGALLMSSMADRIGRLKALTISVLFTTLFDALAAFAPSYFIMVFLRFLAGMFCALVIVVSFVLSQELIGTKWRSTCAILVATSFSFGISLLSAFAAYISDWRTLTFITSLSGVIYLTIPCFVPESPKWLLSKKKLDGAKRVLELIANQNGTAKFLPARWNLRIKDSGNSKEQHHGFFSTLFHHNYLMWITLIQVFSWFANSAVYYALTMSAASITQGNVYWATSVNGLIEIPASMSSIFLIDRFGRRFTICTFMVVGGLVCLFIPAIPASSVSTFALLGKLSISASFSVIFLHSGEIFPTMMRNTAMGMLSVAARVGGIVSPFVLFLDDVYPNLQFVVLGATAFLAGVSNFYLPETLGLPLPDTVSEVLALQHIKRKKDPRYDSDRFELLRDYDTECEL